jgi:tetratricopeptide (TPR) repeat protein
MQPAHSQIDSHSFPAHNSPAQQVVSKNQLLTPEKVQKAMARARERFLHGRYESAQKEIQRALDICPHCASALTFQGVLNLQGHNYPEAARSFQRAIDEDPAAGPAYLGIGVVYNAQARFKEALVVFDRAAPFLPDTWLLPFECALAHLGVGESTAGLREISHAEGLAGSDPAKLSGVAFLHGVAESQLKEYDRAK